VPLSSDWSTSPRPHDWIGYLANTREQYHGDNPAFKADGRFPEVVDCLERGHHFVATGMFKKSCDAYLEGLGHLDNLPLASDDSLVASIRAALAGSLSDSYANLGDFDLALGAADQSIDLLSNDAQNGAEQRRLWAAHERKAFYLAWMGRCDTAALKSQDVITALRNIVDKERDSNVKRDCRNDLARSLDHRAEILERAHSLSEALVAADESTSIRRELAKDDKKFSLPLLRSLVTLARITGALGDSLNAVKLCREGMKSLSENGGDQPLDLRAQFTSCLGRNLMLRESRKGKKQLIAAAELFKSMVETDENASIFRDAYAEVLVDLGVLHLDKKAHLQARHWLIRATLQKRRVVRDDPHPLHQTGLAETMVRLGLADLGCSRIGAALRNFEAALLMFEKVELSNAGFPAIAVGLSEGLIEAIGNDTNLGDYFQRIARISIRAADLADGSYQAATQIHEDAFHTLWLRHFIERRDGNSVMSFLAVAHGRRLGQLAQAELAAGVRNGTLAKDEMALWDKRQQIRRLDLEMAEILSARSPSLIQSDYVGSTLGIISGTGNAVSRAGSSLKSRRDVLFRDYVELRDRLAAEGRYPDIEAWAITTTDLPLRIDKGSAAAVWCIPQRFRVDHPPFLVLLSHEGKVVRILEMPELVGAADTFPRFLKTWRFGRSNVRLGSFPTPQGDTADQPLASRDAIEEELHGHMKSMWNRLVPSLASIGATNLDMVTHADAHNLPWLGTCPDNIRLRQFSSLHFYRRPGPKHAAEPPSAKRPLLLMSDAEHAEDPGSLLYFVPLEIEAIRQIWPGAVINAADPGTDEITDLAAVWMVGHGGTRGGHPIIGWNATSHPLAQTTPFSRGGRHIGLIYASTCFLGQTKDVDDEPVGLTSLAALLPEAPYAAGSSAPVDDLGAALLALLFHAFWKQHVDPRTAFDQARTALKTGAWSDRAKDLFRTVC